MQVDVRKEGQYKLVLNSDRVEFGGEGLLGAEWEKIKSTKQCFAIKNAPYSLQIIVPNRSAILYTLV